MGEILTLSSAAPTGPVGARSGVAMAIAVPITITVPVTITVAVAIAVPVPIAVPIAVPITVPSPSRLAEPVDRTLERFATSEVIDAKPLQVEFADALAHAHGGSAWRLAVPCGDTKPVRAVLGRQTLVGLGESCVRPGLSGLAALAVLAVLALGVPIAAAKNQRRGHQRAAKLRPSFCMQRQAQGSFTQRTRNALRSRGIVVDGAWVGFSGSTIHTWPRSSL